jgi:hypothetical protein
MTVGSDRAGVSEGAAVKTVSDGSGRNQARPLADACPVRRICEYRHCDTCIDDLRPNAKYCDPSHKAAEHRARKADPPGTTYPVSKPYRTVRRARRRANQEGVGTRLYVVSDEVELVRDLLTGKPAGSSAARDRLMAKLPRALERLERRGAA